MLGAYNGRRHETAPALLAQPEARPNTCEVFGLESVRIPLTQGQFALIDAADAALVSRWKWRAARSGATFYARSGSFDRQIWMHRVLLNAPDGVEVDHINGDGLDNRRVNLRLCVHAENGASQRRPKNNTSGFKGVYVLEGLWAASVGGRYLGRYDTPEEAARAYDTEARRRYGEFARPNFPDESTTVEPRLGVPIRTNTSGFEGVAFKKPRDGRQGGWTARFAYQGRRLWLGLFPTKEAAARAWDAKAREVLGPSARLNFPD